MNYIYIFFASFIFFYVKSSENPYIQNAMVSGYLYDVDGLPVETLARAALKLCTTREKMAELAIDNVENYTHISTVAYPLDIQSYDTAKNILLKKLREKGNI